MELVEKRVKGINERIVIELYRRRGELRDDLEFRGRDFHDCGRFAFAVTEIKLENLKLLTEKQRAAFFYNVILDWSQRETAAKLGVTEASVAALVRHGARRLVKYHFGR